MAEDQQEGIVFAKAVRKRVSGRLNCSYTSRGSLAKEDDLACARLKLGNLLDSISRGEEPVDDEYIDEDVNGSTSPIKSKRARGPRKSRKRVREDYMKSSMLILKLFDRTVDLSEFCMKNNDSDPPLYPICRAWIYNNESSSANTSLDEPGSPTDDLEFSSTEKPQGLYSLPAPDPSPIDLDGNVTDLRIPRNKCRKEPVPSLIDESINSKVEESRESLLESNLYHWRNVRQDWKEAAALNHSRYRSSFDVLQALSVSIMPTNTIDEEMLTAM